MNRKIRYALEMGDGFKVRTMKELKEHFDYKEVVGYLADNDRKLREWLPDRSYEKERRAVQEIWDWVQTWDSTEMGSERDHELQRRICEVFGIAVKEQDFIA